MTLDDGSRTGGRDERDHGYLAPGETYDPNRPWQPVPYQYIVLGGFMTDLPLTYLPGTVVAMLWGYVVVDVDGPWMGVVSAGLLTALVSVPITSWGMLVPSIRQQRTQPGSNALALLNLVTPTLVAPAAALLMVRPTESAGTWALTLAAGMFIAALPWSLDRRMRKGGMSSQETRRLIQETRSMTAEHFRRDS